MGETGSPGHNMKFSEIVEAAAIEAEIYKQAGVVGNQNRDKYKHYLWDTFLYFCILND